VRVRSPITDALGATKASSATLGRASPNGITRRWRDSCSLNAYEPCNTDPKRSMACPVSRSARPACPSTTFMFFVEGSTGMDRGDLVKWFDALDALVKAQGWTIEQGLQLARDAQWLASLFPAGEAVTQQRMAKVMLEQGGDDPRAVFLAGVHGQDRAMRRRAAEMGYAPAQAQTATDYHGNEMFEWSEKASGQGNRMGTFYLAWCYLQGRGCEKDVAKAIELYGKAAELGQTTAQVRYAAMAFGKLDSERFYWLGRAASRGVNGGPFVEAVAELLPRFEAFQCGRTLHTVAPLIRANLHVAESTVFRVAVEVSFLCKMQRVLELHDAMLERARQAIDCWSVVGRRRGMVKDTRVMIAKMAFEEAWRWSKS
jgi:hypothetical protein